MTTETEVLSVQELEGLLNQVNTRTPTGARNYALLQLMAQTGIRCGEALQVTAGDIRQEEWQDQAGRVNSVPVLRLPAWKTKGKKQRLGLPLSPATRQALDVWQEKRRALGIGNGPLFCTITQGTVRTCLAEGGSVDVEPGKALNPRYVRDLVARLAAQAGIERRVHPHMLRHTALTNLYDQTRDLRMVQAVAGHTTSRCTERYTHVHPVAVAQAMGALGDSETGQEGEGRA